FLPIDSNSSSLLLETILNNERKPVIGFPDSLLFSVVLNENKIQIPTKLGITIVDKKGTELSAVRIDAKFSESDLKILNEISESIVNQQAYKDLVSFKSFADIAHHRIRNTQYAELLIEQANLITSQLPKDNSEGFYAHYARYAAILKSISESYLNIKYNQLTCNQDKGNPLGLARFYDNFRNTTDWDCKRMDQLVVKIKDRLERLKFNFPTSIPQYDQTGCRLVLDIATSLRDFHNDILIYDDFPMEMYGSRYASKILNSMQALNEIQYKKSAPGEFLEFILPNWQKVCTPESAQITKVLQSFKR
nr:hypothetical protein [Pseudobdellovibrionaceae bacterium]